MTEPITVTDPDDPRVADFRQLDDPVVRARIEGDEFFVSEGWKGIERLIDSQHQFRTVLLSPSRVARFQPFTNDPALADVPVFVAEREVMRDIVGFELPRGVLMSARRRPFATVDELASRSRRLIVLDAFDSNESIGAIARAARAFDVDGIVLSPTCADPYRRRTVRVSMGEILHLSIARATAWPDALQVLQDREFETWAMTSDDDANDLWDTATPERLAVVLGGGETGLTDRKLPGATRRVRIPISASIDSLDAGQAAAITLAAIGRGPHR